MEDNKGKVYFYSNVASINSSVFDFEMSFGRKKFREKGDVSDEDMDVAIVMSPQHAKAFLEILQTNLSDYETQFGEIVINRLENSSNNEQNE